jgi:hypothetical protein
MELEERRKREENDRVSINFWETNRTATAYTSVCIREMAQIYHCIDSRFNFDLKNK